MPNLKLISDSELLSLTKRLASEERRIGIEVLHHLREIDARKLFASLGFSSLFVYCTTELGYSEGGAYRRIATMRLLRDVPEYESKLEEGAVSVATLSQVQSFLVQEKRQLGKTYSTKEKLLLLAQVEGKSSQQTERLLATVSPQVARAEKARIISADETEIRFTAGRELMGKIERLKNLLGHKPGTQSFAGLINELTEIAIKKLDPMAQVGRSKKKKNKVSESAPPDQSMQSLPQVEVVQPKKSLPLVEVESKKATRYISVAVTRAVWSRDGGQCTFINSKNKQRCACRHALELEHILPFATGGNSSAENLKLLCPAHNLHAAVQAYGLPRMQEFWAI
jgi:hypothetical protein